MPAALALALAGCGGSTGNSDTPAATGSTAAGAPADDSNCASADVYCLGLVTDTGKVDDKSFNQSAHEGAQAAAEEANGFYKYIETQDAKDYAANIAQFTNKKYDAIVTVGFLMTDATTAAAKANPTTRFIGVDQGYDPKTVTVKNLTGLIFPEDQAGYGAGYLAGPDDQDQQARPGARSRDPAGAEVREGLRGGRQGRQPEGHRRHRLPPRRRQRVQRPGMGRRRGQEAARPGRGHHLRRGRQHRQRRAAGGRQGLRCGHRQVLHRRRHRPVEHRPGRAALPHHLRDEAHQRGVTVIAVKAKDGDFTELQTIGKAGLAPYHDFESVVPADVKAKVDEVVKQMEAGTLKTGVTL